MDYTIKIVAVDDILDIRHKVLRNNLPIEEVMFNEDKKKTTIHYAICNKSNEVLGCLSLIESIFRDKTAYRLRAMAIIPSKQRHGLGTELMNYMFEDLKKHSRIKNIFCYSRYTSKNFYKRFGFKEVSQVFQYGNAGKSVIMSKAIL